MHWFIHLPAPNIPLLNVMMQLLLLSIVAVGLGLWHSYKSWAKNGLEEIIISDFMYRKALFSSISNYVKGLSEHSP